MYGLIVGRSKMIHAPISPNSVSQDVQQLCPSLGSNPLHSKQLGPNMIAKEILYISSVCPRERMYNLRIR